MSAKYVTLRDYLPIIQNDQLLNQLLDPQEGDFERKFCESWAVEKLQEHLSDKIDLSFELTDTLDFDINKTYKARERAVCDFEVWTSRAWAQGELCVNDGKCYYCQIDNSDGSFDPDKWLYFAKQYDLFYIPTPYPIFSFEIKKPKGIYTDGYYSPGDNVWWENHTYECISGTVLTTDQTRIQNVYAQNIPNGNTFPNDKVNGSKFWKDLGEYSVQAGTLPNVSPWVLGDNRNASFLLAIIDLTVWRLHSRISPNNIPKLREDNMKCAFDWMTKIENGKLQTSVQKNSPELSNSFRWGTKTKQTNGY
jgi:hypothetical protein